MKPTIIDLQIEELILRGLPHAQRHRIALAVEQTLKDLLTERGIPPLLAQGGTLPLLRIDPLIVAHDAEPGAIGAQIAENVFALLSGIAQQ
jgi:hypothetical protein